MVEAAFAEPPLGAQAVFRVLLDALAGPGVVRALPAELPMPPTGLDRGIYAAVLTLVDYEAPLWLAPELMAAAPALRFHTGARIEPDPHAAAFAVAAEPARLPALADFALGSDAYPDRSTTLLLAVSSLAVAGPWRLRGPGIQGERRLGVQGLPFDFVGQWADNHERFPRGVDVLLFAGDVVVGLPRTTRIEED